MKRLLLIGLCSLSACAGPWHGPEADLMQIATPDPAPPLERPAPPQLVGPKTQAGQWRA
jgi:hypothetical protein